jgi:hypothetical protein
VTSAHAPVTQAHGEATGRRPPPGTAQGSWGDAGPEVPPGDDQTTGPVDAPGPRSPA